MAIKYILDTHTLVWYLEGNPKLSTQARTIMDEKTNELVLPIIALAEATFLIEKGRTTIPSIAQFLNAVDSNPQIEVYPLDRAVFNHTFLATVIPEMHDRQIVATAILLRTVGHTVIILTKNGTIKASGLVSVIW
ncbi:type II toxin-antitoxin system VapC family toxin [Candidatus Poribacteria bacterium]|nr:type II toxin-antitoxin system VapC family toxin [Candidatus Poribacteria bacterium]